MTALTLETKLDGQKQITTLESQRSQKRRALFEAQDQVDQQREELIANIEAKLQQKIERNEVLSIRWTVA